MDQDTIQQLGHKDPHTRYKALKTLAVRSEPVTDPAITEVVVKLCRKDKLAYNRLEAMNVLRHQWGREDVVQAFRERLDDEGYIVEEAIRLLGEIRDRVACELLQETFARQDQVHMRLLVIQAFVGADQACVFDFLKATRAHESNDDRLRATVVRLLAGVGNPTLKPLFMKALRDENARVRANAVEALAGICQGKELFQIMAAVTKDRSNRVRANAIKELLGMGVSRAEGLLHEMAHHRNPRYRSSAAWVIGEVGERMANGQTWLRNLTQDADNNVTYRAELAQKKLLARAPSARAARAA